MLDSLFNLTKKVRKIDENKILKTVLSNKTLQAQIIDLNQEQMYDKGIDAKGQSLGEYSPSTIHYWKPKAASEGRDGRTDHVTLKDTGDFYNSMKIKNGSDALIIEADMVKSNTNLETIYPDALGLTDESLEHLRPEIIERMQDEIKKQIEG